MNILFTISIDGMEFDNPKTKKTEIFFFKNTNKPRTKNKSVFLPTLFNIGVLLQCISVKLRIRAK